MCLRAIENFGMSFPFHILGKYRAFMGSFRSGALFCFVKIPMHKIDTFLTCSDIVVCARHSHKRSIRGRNIYTLFT